MDLPKKVEAEVVTTLEIKKGKLPKNITGSKVSKKILTSVVNAFDKMGQEIGMDGEEYFAEWAKAHPTEFYQIFWAKLIPKVSEQDGQKQTSSEQKILILPMPVAVSQDTPKPETIIEASCSEIKDELTTLANIILPEKET